MIRRIFSFLIVTIFLASCNFPGNGDIAQIFASATPTSTSTPTHTPTFTPQPTATPSPTPQPATQVELAEDKLAMGEYEQARRQFQEVMLSSNDTQLQALAALGLGRTLYKQNNFPAAINAFEAFISDYPQHPDLAVAYYYLGLCMSAIQAEVNAALAYQKYIELRPGVLDSFIHELRGNAYSNAGLPGTAIEAYDAAIKSAGDANTIWIEMKLGQMYAQNGEFENAINQFIAIYEKTDNEYAKAQANYLLGQTYLTMGMPEQAYARFQDNVTNYPRSYDSYSGLVALVSAGIEVNELNRGIVDYNVGEYGLAIEALTRYINLGGEQQDGTPYYYRALSLRALDELDAAMADFDVIIEQYPDSRWWAAAHDEKAYTLWGWLDEYDEAAGVLLAFVEQNPTASEAADFLFDAARILERNQQFAEAAATWEKMINDYPSAARSYRGLFLAGVTYYRAQDYPQALLIFQRALVLATLPGDQAAAYLWIGKVQQALGDTAAMQAAWEQAAQRDPTGYYSERANELLQGREPFTPTRPYDLGYDLDQERPKAEEWLRATFSIAPDIDLAGLGELANDANLQRGNAFAAIGEMSLARDEFELVRKKVIADPLATYRLMNYLYNLRFYRSALLASRSILDLANLDDAGTLQAPVYFNHIRFGIYYKDIVLEASQKEDLHPLLLLSVMRQESLFEGFANSSAGARGLMQVMPATGIEIFQGLQWPDDYSADDLYRPTVSIRFGAYYLARQRAFFDNDLIATLAAYNGGPGNTIIWDELASGDPDLLLEVIRADETRKYITQIFEFFNLYRLIYERGL